MEIDTSLTQLQEVIDALDLAIKVEEDVRDKSGLYNRDNWQPRIDRLRDFDAKLSNAHGKS